MARIQFRGMVIAIGTITHYGKGKVTIFNPASGFTTYDTIGIEIL